VKIHLPEIIEKLFAEDFGVQPSIEKLENYQVEDERELECYQHLIRCLFGCFSSLWDCIKSPFEVNLIEKEPSFYRQIRWHGLDQPYVKKIPADNLNYSQKSTIVYQILLRMGYGEGKRVGIENLINDGVYKAYFPLHEEISTDHEEKNDRNVIFTNSKFRH
jgi:hypothetical protein